MDCRAIDKEIDDIKKAINQTNELIERVDKNIDDIKKFLRGMDK